MTGAIVVLDGPDAAGKTTLAESIIAMLGSEHCDYQHLTYIKDDREMWQANYDAYARAIAAMRQGKFAIIDRGWISENVYSRVYRGGSGMPYDVRCFDRLLMRHGALYVMCCPDPSFAVLNHKRTCEERDEMYQPGPQIREVAELFRGMAVGQHTDLPHADYLHACLSNFHKRRDVVHYDIGAVMMLSLAWIIKRATADAERCQSELAKGRSIPYSTNCVGRVDARLIFVGDKVNPNGASPYPFVDYGKSSRLMSRLLHECPSYTETSACWVNQRHEPDGDFDMLKHLATLPDARNKIFVALGQDAAARLHEQFGIKPVTCLHPSYAQRFDKADVLHKQLLAVIHQLHTSA